MILVTLPVIVEAYIVTHITEDGISTLPGTVARSLLSGRIAFRTISPVYLTEGQGVLMEGHTPIVMLSENGTAMLPVTALLDIIRAGMDQMEATVSTVATGTAAETGSLVSMAFKQDLEHVELLACQRQEMSSA